MGPYYRRELRVHCCLIFANRACGAQNLASIIAKRTFGGDAFIGAVVGGPASASYPVAISTNDDVMGPGGRAEKVRFGPTMEYSYSVVGINFTKF